MLEKSKRKSMEHFLRFKHRARFARKHSVLIFSRIFIISFYIE